MGYGRKKSEELRDKRITVQVTKREKERIIELAEDEGMEVSDYIRVNCIYRPFKQFFGGYNNEE